MTGFTYGGEDGATYGTDDGATLGVGADDPSAADGPGFTYGTVNGATYGTDDGGLWGQPFRRWVLGKNPVAELIEETRTWDTLTLVFRSDRATVINQLRPLDSDAGKVEVLERSDGGFDAIDRADGRNTYQITPPAGRIPPRLAGDYLVDEYEEEVVDQQGKQFRVTVTLVPDQDRDTDSHYAETPSGGDWKFDFSTGTIATPRVRADVGGGASKGTQAKRLRLILTDKQVQVLEESASLLNAVRIREVPDGANVAEDNSPGDQNTVTVASPNENVFESGEYVVDEWETVMQNDRFHKVTLTVNSSG